MSGKEITISIKTFRQIRVLFNSLHKKGYVWCSNRSLKNDQNRWWKKHKSNLYIQLELETKRIQCGDVRRSYCDTKKLEYIKPFTEENIKKLIMLERLK